MYNEFTKKNAKNAKKYCLSKSKTQRCFECFLEWAEVTKVEIIFNSF
jgi:hypothetical protein